MMRKFYKSTMGVTLLEIMLVLAIAAMIIVMSVRYYQGASANQQANAFVSQVQAITAGVENLTLGGGKSYSSVQTTDLTPLLGNNAFNTPWGGTISFSGQQTGFQLSGYPTPSAAACTLIRNQLQANNKYTVAEGCGSVTYNAAG
jgi:type II secretory pathway pseudopilin PulG